MSSTRCDGVRQGHSSQRRKPLPGLFDFGQAGVGIILLKPNLTSHLVAIYPPQRGDEAIVAMNAYSAGSAEKPAIFWHNRLHIPTHCHPPHFFHYAFRS
jgi:hypothetical protein